MNTEVKQSIHYYRRCNNKKNIECNCVLLFMYNCVYIPVHSMLYVIVRVIVDEREYHIKK